MPSPSSDIESESKAFPSELSFIGKIWEKVKSPFENCVLVSDTITMVREIPRARWLLMFGGVGAALIAVIVLLRLWHHYHNRPNKAKGPVSRPLEALKPAPAGVTLKTVAEGQEGEAGDVWALACHADGMAEHWD